LGQVHENLARRVLDIKQGQNGSAIIRHGNVLFSQEAVRKELSNPAGYSSKFHTPMSSTIILSKPEGPKELLMTLEIA
jgi:hypothetical protein